MPETDREIDLIKKIVSEHIEKQGLKVERILLFGSRAKGDWRKDSDWDLFIIIDKNITFTEMKKIIGDIQVRLAREKIPNDIIIRSVQEFSVAKESIGNISYYANREGIEI